MSSDEQNYSLKGPQDQIVGFRLGAAGLGHEIYDILDWADEHFSSYAVEQTDGRVYVYSETARETLSADEIRAEPLSIEDGERGDPSNGGSSGGGPSSGGPSGGGGSGGGGGGNVPAAGGGGGSIAATNGH
jgi:uncharacterized membrane protein YgcG